MRLTQKQLILQQQRQLNQQQHQQQQNFFLDKNQNDHKYQHQHQHPPRCQYYPSSTATTPITSPPLPHFPPPPEYPPPSNQQLQHNFHCDFNQQQQHQLSPSHCRTNTKKHHQTQDPNSIEICMDYQMNQQQNNQMNYVGGEQSVSDGIFTLIFYFDSPRFLFCFLFYSYISFFVCFYSPLKIYIFK